MFQSPPWHHKQGYEWPDQKQKKGGGKGGGKQKKNSGKKFQIGVNLLNMGWKYIKKAEILVWEKF